MTLLVAEGLCVRRGAMVAVDGIDLSVGSGEWFGVIGANGSGKTSLLRALAGRLPIAAGRCLIDGREMAADRAERAMRIGFAPPIEMLPSALLARDVLALVGDGVDQALDRLGSLRDALAIDGLLDRAIATFSAGMRQRLAIACGMAGGHDIVVLDEPFNWLDPVAAYDVRQALRALVDRGTILVTALHDLTTLVTACDRALLMTGGRSSMVIGGADLETARRSPVAFEARMIGVLRSGAQS